ncbi:MAG: glycosyltransferase involved in cell wall biosynthesis [Paraglaciecola sp.]
MSRLSAGSKSFYEYKGVKVRVISGVKWSGFETFFHTFFALVYARIFVHPKIVHLHGIGPGIFSWLARAFLFKTIVTYHSQDFLRPKWSLLARTLLKLGEQISCVCAHKVICVSEAIKTDIDKRIPYLLSKRIVIRNAGSLALNQSAEHSQILADMGLKPRTYLLAVGRIEETKAFHELIAAYKLSKIPNFNLVIVGSDYTDSEYLKDLYSNASDNILFVGKRFDNELAALYLNAKILINPSHMEGYCLVVAEALSAKLPVILSDIPPHREFKLPDLCFFKVGDIQMLAQTLLNHSNIESICEEAFLLQQENTWQSNAKKHLSLFSEFL